MKTVYYIIALFLLFAVSMPNLYAQKDKWTGKKDYDNRPYGNGTMTYSNGDVFTGEMDRGRKIKGEFTYTNPLGIKCKYVGFFKQSNDFNGFGKLWWDGNYYVGYFSAGKMSGYGTLVRKDGTTMSGYFNNDELSSGFIADKDGKLIKKQQPQK